MHSSAEMKEKKSKVLKRLSEETMDKLLVSYMGGKVTGNEKNVPPNKRQRMLMEPVASTSTSAPLRRDSPMPEARPMKDLFSKSFIGREDGLELFKRKRAKKVATTSAPCVTKKKWH